MQLFMVHRAGLEQRMYRPRVRAGLCVQDKEDGHLLSPGRSVTLGGGAYAFPEGHFYLVVG